MIFFSYRAIILCVITSSVLLLFVPYRLQQALVIVQGTPYDGVRLQVQLNPLPTSDTGKAPLYVGGPRAGLVRPADRSPVYFTLNQVTMFAGAPFFFKLPSLLPIYTVSCMARWNRTGNFEKWACPAAQIDTPEVSSKPSNNIKYLTGWPPFVPTAFKLLQ